MTTRHVREWDPADLKIVAEVLGPSSAAAQDLVDYEKRSVDGPTGIY